MLPASKGNRVVIVGAGFGGLTAAKQLKKMNKDTEVVVLEKRDIFMSCPFSNTYLGGLEDVSLETLEHDLYAAAIKYDYNIVQCEVTGIDRNAKTVMTTAGDVGYDILLLSPGIAYDYQKSFPGIARAEACRIQKMAPAAMVAGSEHLALKRQLSNMDDGNVVITVPTGKYRCPPAPYERACMIANYMDKEGIEGKVIILDHATRPRAKAAAFEEAFATFYKDRIEFRGDCSDMSVDLDGKKIGYKVVELDDDGKEVAKEFSVDYQVLNFIPANKANAVMEMSGIELNPWGAAIMHGASFRSATDESIYVVGDCVGHAIPPSGQTANWAARQAATQIDHKLKSGKDMDLHSVLPTQAANVCYSMVSGDPDNAIMVTHDFSFNAKKNVIAGKGHVPKPKDGNGKFYSQGIGKATREWYRGIIGDLFG